MRFAEMFQKVRERNHLTIPESREVLLTMMEEEWDPVQTAAFLTALHRKGETSEELAGFATALLETAVPVELDGRKTLDTCGTGGDGKGSLNISTLAAFVLAGCGIPVVKHGNRAVSSSCGSADLLAALGLRYRLKPDEIPGALETAGFAFLFAPDYHPATKRVAAVRKQLGSPTIFNFLGPLCNPARPVAQLIGVYDRQAMPCMAEAFRRIRPEDRALFVHSAGEIDEATTDHDFFLHPSSGDPFRANAQVYGFRPCGNSHLHGGSPEENAKISMMILEGRDHPATDTVLLNAFLAYRLFHPESSIEEARECVRASIDSRAALQVVQEYREKFPGGRGE